MTETSHRVFLATGSAALQSAQSPNETTPVPDSTYLSLAAFIADAKGKQKPLNDAESARRSTLTAMLGRKSIYEKRIVEWKEVDV